MSSLENPNDGLIDFSTYSTVQLNDLRYTINQNAYPLNYANLLTELKRREDTSAGAQSTALQRWKVQFTRRQGLRGWLEARRRAIPVYGHGWIEIASEELILHGWQRTWLGVPVMIPYAVPLKHIRNVVQEDDGVRLQHGRRRRLTFRPETVADVREILTSLPNTQSAGFEQQWSQLRTFYRSLEALEPQCWIIAAIILINFLVFAAMAAVEAKTAFVPQELVGWGGNFAPLTLSGQWWRLLSAAFVHIDPIHLFVNIWALWSVGRFTERLYGRWVFLFIYLSSCLLSGLASLLWHPVSVIVGASGPIFGSFGALLAYLLRCRSEVPIAVIRPHLISIAVFVVFSLIAGSFQTGVDNAAHVGGILSGFAVGWVWTTPLGVTGRAVLRPRQLVGGIAIVSVVASAILFHVTGPQTRLTPSEQYLRERDWYVRDEGPNLKLWQNLLARSAAGTISTLALGNAFEASVVPFWRTAADRLRKEDANLTGERKKFAELVLHFVEVRRDWATEIAAANKKNDTSRGRHIRELQDTSDRLSAQLQRINLRAALSHRPRPLFSYARNLVSGRTCVTLPGSLSQADAKADGPAERQSIGCAAQRAFESEDFSSLEAMFDRYQNSFEDLADGSSSLHGLIYGMYDLFAFPNTDWMQELSRTADWRRDYPNSTFPDYVEAMIFWNWAWVERGGGPIYGVSAQSYAAYASKLEMAEADVRETEARSASIPLWYELSLRVGLEQGIQLDALRMIYDRAHEKFPHFVPIDRQMLRALMPRWIGSYQQVDQFIGDVVAKSPEEERTQTYTLLYREYASLEGDVSNIFEKTKVDWSRMKFGFTELLKQHPESRYLVNSFANLACQAGDVAEYSALRQRVENGFSSTAWSKKVSVASCDQKFASQRS
jgi:membrane associated rhomboid family serine protease